MVSMKSLILDAAGEVIKFRVRYEKVYPWPPDEHCRYFAFTEMGEVIDAYMRSFPEYKRNHDRESDIHSELADLFIMLVSASRARTLNEFARWIDFDQFPYGIPNIPVDNRGDVVMESALARLCFFVGRAQGRTDTGYILMALGIIAAFPGMDLTGRVQRKLDYLANKHGNPPESAWERIRKRAGQMFRSMIQLIRGKWTLQTRES